MLLSRTSISPFAYKSGGGGFTNSNSLLLDGSTKAINVDSGLSAIATSTLGGISLWIKVTTSTPPIGASIFCFGDADGNNYIRGIFVADGKIRVDCVKAGVFQWRFDTTSTHIFQPNVWSHLGIYQRGFGGKIVKDGYNLPLTTLNSTSISKWLNDIPLIDTGRIGCQNLNGSGDVGFLACNVKDILFFDGLIFDAADQDVYNLGTPKDETNATDAVAYYRTGDGTGDNWNVDNANQWTFKDLIGSNDIFTIGGSQGDVVADVPTNQAALKPLFNNSVTYSTGKRSTDSEYEFNYSGTVIKVQADVSGVETKLAVFVDGAYSSTLTMVDKVPQYVTFSSGAKVIKLIEGTCRNSGLTGVRINSLALQDSLFSKIDDGNVASRLVLWGDSITQGDLATNHFIEGFAQLYKYTGLRNTTILGYAGAKVREFGETPANVTESISWLNKAFADTTTTKEVLIALGVNDFLQGETAVNVGIWAENFLEGITTARPDVTFYWMTPLDCASANSTLVDIRTAITTACGNWGVTVIDGSTILTYPTNYANTNHPDILGHLDVYNTTSLTV